MVTVTKALLGLVFRRLTYMDPLTHTHTLKLVLASSIVYHSNHGSVLEEQTIVSLDSK